MEVTSKMMNDSCSKCGEIVNEEGWDFPVCMCKACSSDRSRWKCLDCGDNLGLEKPPYEGDFFPVKDYCDICVNKAELKV